MFFLLFILISNEPADSTVVDSLNEKEYEVPQIVNFSQTGVLDSSLKQEWVIKPILFFNGFKELIYFTPYIIKDRGYALDIIAPYPLEISFPSHGLNNYFIESLNLVSLPINFLKTTFLNKGSGQSFHKLEIDTKVNTYKEPYSYLYFTMFGNSAIYNLDFTRAITNDAGFYLSGLYSRQYKSFEQKYLRTNGGYADIYYNKFIPARMDVIFVNNDYDRLWNIDFSDITITAGNAFYKTAIFRTENKIEYLDTIMTVKNKNLFTTYGTNQQILFYFKNLENILGLNATMNYFKYNTNKFKTHNHLEFYQMTNYHIRRFYTGLGYWVDYEMEKNMYFNPNWRIAYDISNKIRIFGGLNLFSRRANFVAQYGNENLIDKEINILGNSNIKDEKFFHKEIGFQVKNSMLNFFHCLVSNPIVLRKDSTDYYSAINLERGEIAGFEIFYDTPIGKYFSLTGAGNYLLKNEPSSIFPKTNLKLYLNWHRETARSRFCLFIRFNYLSDRYDRAGNHYAQFWTIAPGLMMKFLTLRVNMMIDNILNEEPGDFPNTARSFNFEVNWEFWD